MELYFKDLESNDHPDDATAMVACDGSESHDETADDVALAELSERVYAAGLVY
jgi:hypothetical protein